MSVCCWFVCICVSCVHPLKGVVGHTGPGHVAEGPAGQSSGGGEIAEREGQNHGQTPDTHDNSHSGLRRQTRLQWMNDGHVPTG